MLAINFFDGRINFFHQHFSIRNSLISPLQAQVQSPKLARGGFADHLVQTGCRHGRLQTQHGAKSVARKPQREKPSGIHPQHMGTFSPGSAAEHQWVWAPHGDGREGFNGSKASVAAVRRFGLFESTERCGATAISGTWKVVPHLASLREAFHPSSSEQKVTR